LCDHGPCEIPNLEQILMMTTTVRHRPPSLTAGSDGLVYRDDQPLRLPPKEQAALHLLVRRSPAIVDKDEFAEHVWPSAGMSDESLAHCIHRIRQLLREAGEEAHIESMYGKGYRLALERPNAKKAGTHVRLLAAAQAPPHITEALIFARQLFSQRTAAALLQATNILRDTIRNAPDYAPARVALAECLAGCNSWGVDIDTGLIEEGLRHLDVAEESMPTVAGLHSARAFLLDRAWRFREARSASEKALRDNPHDPDTNFHYGWHLLATDQAPAACKALQQAVSLHPYSVLLRVTLARAHAHAGDAEVALREAQAACDLAPGNEMAELVLTSFRAWLQPSEEVVDSARKLAASPVALTLAPSTLSYALARTGRRAEAETVMASDIAGDKANACTNAMHASSLLVLGRDDDAMTLLERALAARCGVLPILLLQPANAALRNHPRYAEIHRQIFSDM
jgi:DNA-binding winged helix-turn-helix (wHTH) protein/Flp pilus assembly protein TadD